MANEPNYSSNPSKDEPKKEKVRVIPLEYIDEFPGHPFKVLDDESMQKLMNSIEEIGVQSPIVARIKEDQRYEIISGHTRVHACRRLGLKLIPAIVRDLSRDEAIIAMVDANLQREHILPSEKAAAYKMKMDAVKHQGIKDENAASVDSADLVGQAAGDSGRTVQRYIRLTCLIPELLKLLDEGKINFTVGVSLTYLSETEQIWVKDCIVSGARSVTGSMATKLKQYSGEGKLTELAVQLILNEKKTETGKVTLTEKIIRKYFPKEYNREQIEQVIYELLDNWKKSQ